MRFLHRGSDRARLAAPRLVRRAMRPVLGRDRPLWRLLRSPSLRFRTFHDALDCVIYGLLISLPRVRFLQIGANDGRTDDRLWTFRRYPTWSGVLVEPRDSAFRQLGRNYGPWPGRFTLVNAAVASTSGVRPFYHFSDDGLPGHLDQIGSLDETLLRRHQRHLSLPQDCSIGVTEVRCMTFAELCESSGVANPNVVLVDAEGSDAAIIAQLDLVTCRPEVIAYEHVHLTEGDRSATAGRLEGRGYATLPVGQDTLGVAEEALVRLPLLAEAWRMVEATRGRDDRAAGNPDAAFRIPHCVRGYAVAYRSGSPVWSRPWGSVVWHR